MSTTKVGQMAVYIYLVSFMSIILKLHTGRY